MRRHQQAKLVGLCIAVFILAFPRPVRAHAQTLEVLPDSAEGTYVAAFRTSAHVTYSSSAVFNDAVDSVVEFLRSSHAVLANDPLRDPSRSIPRLQVDMSRENLLAAAKIAGATHLLLITVDRPFSQWMKITLKCYDLTGKLVWQESAGHTGSLDLNGNKALPDIMNKLSHQLQARIGKAGLPLPSSPPTPKQQAPPVEPPAVAIQPPAEEVPGNASLAAKWSDSETKSPFPECEDAKGSSKPLLPYILRADKHDKIDYEAETDFWSTLGSTYPSAIKALNNCFRAASTGEGWKEAAQAGIIISAVEKLRGDALGWATTKQLKENEAVRKDVLAYIGQTQQQALETARYVGQLEGRGRCRNFRPKRGSRRLTGISRTPFFC